MQPLKTGDQFLQALKEKKIFDSTDEEIKQVLKLVMLKIGMRAQNLPDEVEKQVLISHIRQTCSEKTCQEIRLAFDLGIEGKLDTEVTAFENFSCLYFSRIMNAYRVWTQEEYKKIMKDKPLELPPVDQTPFTDEERVETDKFLYKTTKNRRLITQKVAAILFKQKKIEKPCEDDCKKIEAQAISIFHEELKSEIDPKSGLTVKSILSHMTHEQKEKEIRKIMNQILVAKYFNSL